MTGGQVGSFLPGVANFILSAVVTEDRLIGWLVFYRLQCDLDDPRTQMPTAVQEALVEKGWLEMGAERNWNGTRDGHITDAGIAVTDLAGPEWGVDSIPSLEEM